MRNFLTWAIKFLLEDQRGEVGDDDPAGDTSDKDDKGDQDKEEKDEDEEEEEDLDELFIDLDEKDEEEDEEAKKKAAEAKAKTSDEEIKKLQSEVEAFKEKEKEWKRDMYQARKDRETKGLETDKDAKPLTDAQLEKIIGDAREEGDGRVELSVLKYLAQQVAKGEVKEAVTAAEMSRKADDLTKRIEEKFPAIKDPTSDMRADIDKTKEELGIVDHPYGDMFALGFKLFEDMDELIEGAYEAGKEDVLKGTADKKRKEEIKAKSLPSSKKSAYKKPMA